MTEPIKLPPIPPEWQGLWNNGDKPVYRSWHMEDYARLAVEQNTAELRAEVEKLREELAWLKKHAARLDRGWPPIPDVKETK
jgi:hypothetical protein